MKEPLKKLTEILPERELKRRDIEKHNKIKNRIYKDFKRMPYADIIPQESLAQRTIAFASMDRLRFERRKQKKLCQKKR
jgi:hypothetical protein